LGFREEKIKKFALRNQLLEEQITILTKKKENILKGRKKIKNFKETPIDKELDALEREFKALQMKNQKLNNLLKTGMNKDNSTRFFQKYAIYIYIDIIKF